MQNLRNPKKIGEVLRGIECCSDFDPKCWKCPYLDDHFAGRSCVDNRRSDELHYLYSCRRDALQAMLRNQPPLMRKHVFGKGELTCKEIVMQP